MLPRLCIVGLIGCLLGPLPTVRIGPRPAPTCLLRSPISPGETTGVSEALVGTVTARPRPCNEGVVLVQGAMLVGVEGETTSVGLGRNFEERVSVTERRMLDMEFTEFNGRDVGLFAVN